MSDLHMGDVGTIFKVTVKENGSVLDISDATVKQFIFRKPSGAVVTKTAIFNTDGSDGILNYTTVTGDLNVKGKWQVQVYIELPSGKWHSDVQSFYVSDIINSVS